MYLAGVKELVENGNKLSKPKPVKTETDKLLYSSR